MDLSKNCVLKENEAFLVADADGHVAGGEHGLYYRDTRFLDRYLWDLGAGVETLLSFTPRPDRFRAHYARIAGPSQLVGYSRELSLAPRAMRDRLTVENTGGSAQTLTLKLAVGGDFVDMFEARGWITLGRDLPAPQGEGDTLRLRYTAKDGLELSTTLTFSPAPDELGEGVAEFRVALEPGQSWTVEVRTELEAGTAEPNIDLNVPRPSYESWRESIRPSLQDRAHEEVLGQAVDDLRALLISTEHGLMPAAGIPWFVAPFGRDALLTSIMMLPWRPDVAEGTLRYLAAHQGRGYDELRAEAPGKIMHERRYGELTRLGKTPHSPYYGTIDATPLFVVALHELWTHAGTLELVRELQPNWEAALAWMEHDGDLDGDGFLEFVGSDRPGSLAVQSWKDSGDSMSHADGSLAQGALAVSEVQGYAYAAYRAAGDFYDALGQRDKAEDRRAQATRLQERFHASFWLEELQTYAMALDGNKRPLKVQNSDAGQVLWTGIVPEEIAPRLVKTLMGEALWTGWGIRTLGKGEARYNPVSYHNGSVWPHDTALAAGGMARYGFHEEVSRIHEALYSLAASQGDRRLPELVAGYRRKDEPPIPYPVACRPQAWDAAALLYLLRLTPS